MVALRPFRALSLLVVALAIPQLTSAQTNLQHLPPPSSRSPTEQAPDEHTLGGGGVGGGSVQVHGDSVLLVATLDGDVHAVAGSTGELLWSLDAGGPLIGSSAFDLGSLFATDAAEPPPGAEATGAFASPSAPTQRDPGSGSSGGAWADVASAEKARREAARSSEARGEGSPPTCWRLKQPPMVHHGLETGRRAPVSQSWRQENPGEPFILLSV